MGLQYAPVKKIPVLGTFRIIDRGKLFHVLLWIYLEASKYLV